MGLDMGTSTKLVVMGNMTLLDWFATFAPEPSEADINTQRHIDRNKVHHNDRFIARDDMTIICELRYKYAKEMMKARML